MEIMAARKAILVSLWFLMWRHKQGPFFISPEQLSRFSTQCFLTRENNESDLFYLVSNISLVKMNKMLVIVCATCFQDLFN